MYELHLTDAEYFEDPYPPEDEEDDVDQSIHDMYNQLFYNYLACCEDESDFGDDEDLHEEMQEHFDGECG